MVERMRITIRDIEWVVCAKFKLSSSEIRGPRRFRRITGPRHIVMFLARELAGASYPKLGLYFHCDHTTAMQGVRRVQSLIQTNPKVAAYVDECRAAFAPVIARRAQENALVEGLLRGEVSWPRQSQKLSTGQESA